ncbi:MAG: S-layer homology domain-containing protein, partial [Clostridia bacterium]|nr:S-layer homology domain-containing protein [Clostridia bacterium]
FLAAVLLFCAVTPAFAADDYTDVKENRWSRAAVMYVTEKGYMNGVSDGKFDPAGSMTRAMFVTVLWRREGSPSAEYRPDFSDVKSGKYYSKAVIWAKDNGIVSGVTETKFDPDGKITREQLATMLYRYCSVKNLYVDERGDVSVFSDRGKIHSYAGDALSWAVGVGLIGGVTKDSLDPRGLATREQVATILKRFDEADIITLADYYRPYVEQIADHAEEMLLSDIERISADPDFNMTDLLTWGYGLLAMGLNEIGRYDVVEDYLDLWISHPVSDAYLCADAGLVGYCALDMYERTGEQKYKDLCELCLEGLLARRTDKYGEIKYDSNETETVLVDGTGMVTPFLARYAHDFGDKEVERIAVLQVTNYLKMGVDPGRHLAYHGYENGIFAGEMGWGRGTGYLMLAIGSVMRYCHDEKAIADCEKFIQWTFKYLKPEYKFGWTLSDPDADSDTSATFKIMWGVMKAKEVGLATSISDDMIKKIAKAGLTDVYDGVVKGSSGGSGGFGSYSDLHDENTGYGQGAALAFYVLFLRYLENS